MTSARSRALSVALACLIVTGCAGAPPSSSPPIGRADLLDFLAPGATMRGDVLQRLGEPNAAYEGQRILVYRLRRDDGGYVLSRAAAGSYWGLYNAVLVFDADGILRRHSLLEVQSR